VASWLVQGPDGKVGECSEVEQDVNAPEVAVADPRRLLACAVFASTVLRKCVPMKCVSVRSDLSCTSMPGLKGMQIQIICV